LKGLIRSGASGAIKLGPASDFVRHFGADAVEIELVSLGGECKEATVWFGGAAGCRRRATCLPAGATWTDADGPADAAPAAAGVGPLVFDVDPTLARAGLVAGFAAAHGLARLAEGIDWLTGEAPVASPFLRAFRVIAAVPADDRRLRAEVASAGGGALDVRLRGVARTPESIRRALRPRGDRPLTLFLHGGGRGGPGRAILAEPA
jgi:hypothetical protein